MAQQDVAQINTIEESHSNFNRAESPYCFKNAQQMRERERKREAQTDLLSPFEANEIELPFLLLLHLLLFSTL